MCYNTWKALQVNLHFQSKKKNNRWMEYSPSPFYTHWKHPPPKQVKVHLWEENPSNFKHSQQLQIHYNPSQPSLLLISSKYNMPNYISQTLEGQGNIMHFLYTHVRYIQASFPLSDVQSAIVTPGLKPWITFVTVLLLIFHILPHVWAAKPDMEFLWSY